MKTRWLLVLLWSLCLTTLQVRTIELIHHDHRAGHENAARGVLIGRPHFRNYQSRVLGPLAVAAVGRITGEPYSTAYGMVCTTSLLLGNLLVFVAFARRDLGHMERAALYSLAYAASFVALQDRVWLYVWDYVDFALMFATAWAIVDRAPVLVLVPIFALELLNHEVGLFVAAWLALTGIAVEAGRLRLTAPRRVIGGALLGIAGGVLLAVIRQRLFVEATIDASEFGLRTLGDSLLMLPTIPDVLLGRGLVGTGRDPIDVVATVLPLGLTPLVLVPAWPRLGPQAWRIPVLLAGLVASVVLFGLMREPRVCLVLMPFMLWFAHIGFAPAAISTAPGR